MVGWSSTTGTWGTSARNKEFNKGRKYIDDSIKRLDLFRYVFVHESISFDEVMEREGGGDIVKEWTKSNFQWKNPAVNNMLGQHHLLPVQDHGCPVGLHDKNGQL